jgi:hypothetical protein
MESGSETLVIFRDVFPLTLKPFLKAFTPPIDSEIKGNTKESQGEYLP